MPIAKEVVATALLDLVSQAPGFRIDVEPMRVGPGVGARPAARNTRHVTAMPKSYEVTATKLKEAAERLRKGWTSGVLAGDVETLEASFRIVTIYTDRHRVIVRGVAK